MIVNPNKVGTFQVICAELCGAGHGVMRARVIVMRPAAYDAWYAQAQRDVAAQSAPAAAPAATPRATSTTPPAQGSTTAPAQGATTTP